MLQQIDTEHFDICVATLEYALEKLKKMDGSQNQLEYNMARSSCIKEFEIILEQSGKLLRKVLKPYFSNSAAVDRLNFKDIFRHSVLHGLLSVEESERWLEYRDSRNTTAHDYGEEFAEKVLVFLPIFANDAKNLSKMLGGAK
jgi:nucleotidyltransferase substrate binding protein (TIGR01987 family)